MGQILTCWIFVYSDNNNRTMLMYFIWAPAPLFLWYIEHRGSVLVLGHNLNCLSKKQVFTLHRGLEVSQFCQKHAGFIMTVLLGLTSTFFVVINESKTSVLFLLSNTHFY